jgi:hypothetical protein
MNTNMLFWKVLLIGVFSISTLCSHAQKDTTVRIVNALKRDDNAGEAIIIQRHRNDPSADKWLDEYLKVTRKKITNYLKDNKASGCSNLDFEDSTFANWIGQTGVNNGYPAGSWVNGIVAGRHTIVSSGTDPYGGFPMLAPNGGTYSVKLGNDNVNYEAEQLIYTFTVQPQDTNFIYKYAVVLQDPAHSPAEQPYFEFKIYDSNDSIIPCSYKKYTASGSIPGFISNGDIRYKPWATTGINLSQYIGQTITVVVTSADCSQGAHFGYGYIDFICPASLSITPNVYCANDTSVVLNAPIVEAGMNFTWSTGQTGQAITINPQIFAGSSINCFIESSTSVGLCGFWYVFPIQVVQISLTVSVSDPTITADAIGVTYQWLNCDSGYNPIIGEVNQSFTATANGNYAVVITQGYCSDTSVCINISNVGIESNLSRGISIYPNPVYKTLILEAPQAIETYVSITDIQGKIWFEPEKISSCPYVINISLFEKGMYFLKTSNKNGISVYKIIKE